MSVEDLEEIEVEGQTLEEAKLRAEGRLGALAEDIEFSVLQEGKPGMLGLFARPWRIRARRRESVGERAAEFVQSFFAELGADVHPVVSRDDDHVLVSVEGEFDWFLRRRGEALDALQYLVAAAVGKKGGERIVLDVGGYRAARRQALERMAREVAQRVRESGQESVLEAMPASERRIIHSIIQTYPDLQSQSRGEEPHRQVVVQKR
jgi:spoIIIJ-associated protein